MLGAGPPAGTRRRAPDVCRLIPCCIGVRQRYSCDMLPEFEGGGLPPGIHHASWQEVRQRFGGHQRREWLLVGLQAVLEELARVGCTRVWLDGSFVTAKREPGDYDLVWDLDGVDHAALDPVLKDLAPPRQAQHDKYRGDVLPNVIEGNSGMPFVEFFQQDAVTGRARGIVELNLEKFR